jgi:anti-sigma B factor antagonist
MLIQNLQVDVTPIAEPRGRILHFHGPLVISNLQVFRSALRRDYALFTILDLTDVPFMDSTGLGEIINFYTLCQRSNGRVVLAAPSPRVADLLHMTRVDTILTIAPTVDAAKA